MDCSDMHRTKIAASFLDCAFETLKDEEDSFSCLICPICQDQFETPIMQCQAGHAFCKSCIEHWLDKKSSCPSCRKSLNKSSLSRNLVMEQAIEELIEKKLVKRPPTKEKKCFLKETSSNSNCRQERWMAVRCSWNIVSLIVMFALCFLLAKDVFAVLSETDGFYVGSNSTMSSQHNLPMQHTLPPVAQTPAHEASTPTNSHPVLPSNPNSLSHSHSQLPTGTIPPEDTEKHLPLSQVLQELGYHASLVLNRSSFLKRAKNTESLVLKLRTQLKPVCDLVIEIAEIVGKTTMYMTVEVIKWVVIFVVLLVDFACTTTWLGVGLISDFVGF